jgi:hypothetical protein
MILDSPAREVETSASRTNGVLLSVVYFSSQGQKHRRKLSGIGMHTYMFIGGNSTEVIRTIGNVQIFMVKLHISLPNGGKSRVVQLQNVKLEDTSYKHSQLRSLRAALSSNLRILSYG